MVKRINQIEDFLLKWGLAAILIAIPIYPKFPLFQIPGTYVAGRAEDFLIGFLSIVFIVYIVRRLKTFFANAINQAFFLFFAVGLVSALSAIFITQMVQPHLVILHWLRRIEYVIPFFVAAAYVRDLKLIRFYIEVLLVTAAIVFVYGIGQIYWEFPVISTQNEEFAKGLALRWRPGVRLHSTFGGHYDLAAFLVMALTFAFTYFFMTKKTFVRLLTLISITTSYWLLLMSGSRISVAAYFLAAIVVLWLLNKRLFLAGVLAISVIMVFTVGDLAQKYRYTFETTGVKVIKILKERISPAKVKGAPLNSEVAPQRITVETPAPTPVREDRSTSIRLNAEWPRALNAFYKNPLLGTGYSSISLATDNDYLRILGETGLLGLLSFALIIFRLVQRIWLGLKMTTQSLTKGAGIGALGIIISMLVTASFIDVFEASKVAIVFWTLVGIAVGGVSAKEEAV